MGEWCITRSRGIWTVKVGPDSSAWRSIIRASASISSTRSCTGVTRAPCRGSSPVGKARESRSVLKPELQPTELLIEAWVRQLYDHTPIRVSAIYTAMRLAAGAALPSDPPFVEEAVALLDRILAQSDSSVKRFIEVWYCRGGSVAQKAERLGISREALYCKRKIEIEYLRDRLRDQGLEI
jgi:hypothetical protein